MENQEIFRMQRRVDEDIIYQGKPVRIRFPNNSYLGVIDEIHKTYFLLKPSIISEGLVNINGTDKPFARVEKEIPLKINRSSAIESIEPLSQGYLNNLVESINSQYSKPFFIKTPDNLKSSL